MIIKYFHSFLYALNGVYSATKRERNTRTILICMLIVIASGIWFNISATEWCMCMLAIGLVLSTELTNSAVERLADTITTEYHPQIGLAKDIAAGAVLITVIFSVIVGGIVFIPKVIALFQ